MKSFYYILVSILFYTAPFFSFAQHQNLKPLKSFNFVQNQTKVLPGKSTEKKKQYNCSGSVYEEDKIGNFLLITMLYQNGCYTDGRYNHNNYKVEQGKIVNYDAYTIYEAQNKATEFLGSQQYLHYKFPEKKDFVVYQLENDNVIKLFDVAAKEISLEKHTRLNDLSASKIEGSLTIFIAPKNEEVSIFHSIGKDTKAAKIAENSLGNLYKYKYKVKGIPFDIKKDFTSGPASHANVYSHVRNFFRISASNNKMGIIWQDQKDNTIYLTYINKEFNSSETFVLPNTNKHDLVAVTFDQNNSIFYATIENQEGNRNTKAFNIYKVNQKGKLIKSKKLDSSKGGLNITSFGKDNVASLQYQNGMLGMIFGRTMHKSSDGLNHQGAIAIVINANDLSLIKNFGQTSGHSFENVLTVNSEGKFLGIDLGDNYPRGINLHKFNQEAISSKVVYTFKTLHGNTPSSPARKKYPLYKAISRGSKKYFQWSNDNNTYTELGGVIEGEKGYSVVFVGEPNLNGKALDGTRVGSKLNDSRNIGLVQVIKNFETVSSKVNVVSEDLTLTKGVSESGGFYTFQGSFNQQKNSGVVWLTKYQDSKKENASRLKAVKLSDNNILLVWEKWAPSMYMSTYACKINNKGKLLSEIVELGNLVRLDRRDDIWAQGNSVYIVSGDAPLNSLELVVFEVK